MRPARGYRARVALLKQMSCCASVRLESIGIAISWMLGLALVMSLPSCKSTPAGSIVGVDTTAHNISWKVDTLGTYGSALLDICAVSATSIYAVGVIWDASGKVPTFVIHWDGTKWSDMRDDSLNWWIGAGAAIGVHAISDTALYVVGSRVIDRDALPMIARWDGKTWKNITPQTPSVITSIWANSVTNVYAMGNKGRVLHYDGVLWNELNSPTQMDYCDAFGLPGGEIYAVACNQINSYNGGAVVRISGGVVTTVFSQSIGRILGIGGTSARDLYAVGDGVLHLGAEGTWGTVTVPDENVTLYGVAADQSNNVVLLGAYGKTIHWSGESWSSYETLYNRAASTRYYRAVVTGGLYFLVGDTGSRALLATGAIK
jgi:hypothetical protein